MTVSPLSLHFLQHHPQNAAKVLEQFKPEQLADYLVGLPTPSIANIFRYMTPLKVTVCLTIMEVTVAAKILEQFSIERASALLRRMEPNIRMNIIKAMSTLYANMIKLVIKFPEDTVGHYINPNVFTVIDDRCAKDALSTIKNSKDQIHSEVFVVNDKQRLEGMVYIGDLLMADPETPIKKIMSTTTMRISARTRIAHVQHNPEWKYNDLLPVVDSNGLFIGVLRRSVMLDALAKSSEITQQDDITGAAVSVAEVFWNTCTDLLMPEVKHANKRSQNE